METQNDTGRSITGRAIVALSVAMMLAGLFVIQYLLTTSFGGQYFKTPLIDFIAGQAYDLSGKGADMLFVISTRFMLATACLWLPILLVFAVIGGGQRRQPRRVVTRAASEARSE